MTHQCSGPMLELRNVTLQRAGLPVVRDVSVNVEQGQVCVLLGANGAGKSTVIDGISGVIPVTAGTVWLGDERIDRWRPVRRARAGIAHVEAGRSVFPTLTTDENLRVALPPGADIEEAFTLFPELSKRRHIEASLMSGGEQQMLVLARAWLRRPKVFLLDELSLGLAPRIVARLMESVREVASRGAGVLLVEQFAQVALESADRAYVMRGGAIVFGGAPHELLGNSELLQKLYLGASAAPVAT